MSETNPQGEAVQPSQKVRKPRVITGILIGLIVLAGGAFYYSSQVMDEDAPPTLEAVESGSKYQGLTTGGNHEFAMWEAEDLVEFNRIKAEAAIAGITPIDIDAGVNYLYAPAKITYGDVFKLIDPVAEELVISQYDPETEMFLIYPKTTYYNPAATIEVELDQELEKGEGFMIVAKEPSKGYWLNRGDTTVDLEQTQIAQMLLLLDPNTNAAVANTNAAVATSTTADLLAAQVAEVAGQDLIEEVQSGTLIMNTDVITMTAACELPIGWNLIVVENDINSTLGVCFDKVDVLWTQIEKVTNANGKVEEKFEKIYKKGSTVLNAEKVENYEMTHKLAWVKFGEVAETTEEVAETTEEVAETTEEVAETTEEVAETTEEVAETTEEVAETTEEVAETTEEVAETTEPQIATSLKVVDDLVRSNKVILSWKAPDGCGERRLCEYTIFADDNTIIKSSDDFIITQSLKKPTEETTYRITTNAEEAYAEVTYTPAPFDLAVKSLRFVEKTMLKGPDKLLLEVEFPDGCEEQSCVVQLYIDTEEQDTDGISQVATNRGKVTGLIDIDVPTTSTTYKVRIIYSPISKKSVTSTSGIYYVGPFEEKTYSPRGANALSSMAGLDVNKGAISVAGSIGSSSGIGNSAGISAALADNDMKLEMEDFGGMNQAFEMMTKDMEEMWVEVDDSPLGSKIDPVGPVATDKLTNATTPQDQLSKTSTTMDTAMQELDETSQTSDLGTGYADLGGLGLSDGAMEIGTDLSGTDLSGTDLSEIGLSEIGLSETSGMNDTSITDFGMDAGSAGQAVGVMPTGFSF